MNPDQYKIWIGDLPKLTPTQVMDLSTRIKLLAQVSVKEYDGKAEFSNRVLQAVCDVLKKLNVETPSPTMLKKSAAYVSSKDKMQDLIPYFEKASKSKMVQDAILRKGIELLYYDLVAWQGISISSHTLLRQIHRIPSTLNKSFPGYADSGLLCKLVNAA